MNEPRNWLCLITSTREFENIAELTEDVWTHFDGICAVVHQQGGDDSVVRLLNDRKKAGFVVEAEWLWHHSHSMNRFLLDRRIRLMDCLWLRDSTERFNPEFTASIRGFSADLLSQNIWNLAQRSKLLMFRRWYGQQFVNGLHWGLSGLHGPTIALDAFPQFQNDRDYAYSVRAEKRPPTHRYVHELSYLIDYGPNGNHLALFHPNPQDLEAAQERLYAYTTWLADQGVTTAEQMIQRWRDAQNAGTPLARLPLCPQERDWINAERPFRNAYRFYALGHTDAEILRDEDTWRIT